MNETACTSLPCLLCARAPPPHCEHCAGRGHPDYARPSRPWAACALLLVLRLPHHRHRYRHGRFLVGAALPSPARRPRTRPSHCMYVCVLGLAAAARIPSHVPPSPPPAPPTRRPATTPTAPCQVRPRDGAKLSKWDPNERDAALAPPPPPPPKGEPSVALTTNRRYAPPSMVGAGVRASLRSKHTHTH